MTWTDTSSPTRRAAAAPASVAALTAATSPRTIAVTYPAPIFSQPTSVTFAALTMASAASIIATRPLVSIIPNASPISVSFLRSRGAHRPMARRPTPHAARSELPPLADALARHAHVAGGHGQTPLPQAPDRVFDEGRQFAVC